jgi:regulator of protease activity HflC (stomatin/prohibitin superfamily)
MENKSPFEDNYYQHPINETREFPVAKLLTYVIIFLIIFIALFNIAYTIPAGYRGVLLTFGKPEMVAITEGLHFKIPFIQQVVKMQVQTQKYEAELTASSSDLQDVKTVIAINYHINPESAPTIYRDIGIDYSAKIIYPLEQEANKATTAKYTAEQLITKRDMVREEMKTLLTERLQPRGIVVEEISIVNFKFSDVFTQAIENKVTAEQNALASKNKLEQIKYEAEQRIAQAQGEAEAIRIQVESINKAGGDNYVKLQYIQKWNGAVSQVSCGDNGMNMLMDVSKLGATQ